MAGERTIVAEPCTTLSRSQDVTATSGITAVLPAGDRMLVLVAGIPGAGKSTLLRALPPAGLTVVDSDQVREWLRRRLPAGTSYRLHRPLVHLLHRVLILRAVWSAAPRVIVHLPATAARTRRWLALAGMLGRRERTLVWLDVDPVHARLGQHSRGRVPAAGGFGRHVRHAALFTAALRAGAATPGWRVVVVNREATVRFAESGQDPDPDRSLSRPAAQHP